MNVIYLVHPVWQTTALCIGGVAYLIGIRLKQQQGEERMRRRRQHIRLGIVMNILLVLGYG